MLKLLSAIILLSSISYAETTSEKVEDFLFEQFGDNPKITKIDVKVVDVVKIPKPKNFQAYIVLVKASVKNGAKERKVAQRMVYFSDGNVITKELTDLSSGESMVDYVKPDFKKEFYTKENLIYGNADAKHRVAFFSDPLCPFCRSFVPKAIEEMKKQPKKFAIYYYHFPLDRIHPASVVLVKAAVAAELAGKKDAVLSLYKVHVNARETNPKIILKAFNKTMGTNITLKDIDSKSVKKHFARDMQIADYLMVGGTPTVYFDDKIDETKKKYTKVK
jgi:predicted DsbA family dithiol-disulfide isomerase